MSQTKFKCLRESFSNGKNLRNLTKGVKRILTRNVEERSEIFKEPFKLEGINLDSGILSLDCQSKIVFREV